MITRHAVFALAAALACGCRSVPQTAPHPAPPDGRGRASGEQQAAALSAAMQQAGADYKISAKDLVSVSVYNNPDMSRKVRVNANGMIALPLVGEIKIGGKTLSAARTLIEKKLSDYVVNPQVTVFVEENGNKMFYVMGEVQKPGSYPIPTESRITVLEAIGTAGGFTPIAAPDRARVLRNVDGKSVSYPIDVKAITRQGQNDQDIVLEPNDVIFVPQSMF